MAGTLPKIWTLSIVSYYIRYQATKIFGHVARSRVEVTTPISDWTRAYEAVFLSKSGQDPYSGNLFHEYPISLQVYKALVEYTNPDIVFPIVDTLTAILLYYSTYNQLITTNGGKDADDAKATSFKVFLFYTFSPLAIVSCAGQSTVLFTNMLIALINLTIPFPPVQALTAVLCALLACNNMHYATIIIPIFLCQEYSRYCQRLFRIVSTRQISAHEQPSKPYYMSFGFSDSFMTFLSICGSFMITLLLASYMIMGRSWTFLNSTYLFTLSIGDLTPNIGMFWYFLTEVFDHFSTFFVAIVQLNAFIHVIPLSYTLRNEPYFLQFISLLTTFMFQPYPSLANLALLCAYAPRWSHLLQNIKYGFPILCTAITSLSLLPIFWHLWIVTGTANANFYFASTLILTGSIIAFTQDLLFAHNHVKAKELFQTYKAEHIKSMKT